MNYINGRCRCKQKLRKHSENIEKTYGYINVYDILAIHVVKIREIKNR